MQELVGTYYDEWKTVVDDPERQKHFRQFVNTTERRLPVEQVVQRGQPRPADWAKAFPPSRLTEDQIGISKDQWGWRPLAKLCDLVPTDAGTTQVDHTIAVAGSAANPCLQICSREVWRQSARHLPRTS